MASVTVSGFIARPIDDVFDYVSDTRNDVHWAPLVSSVALVRGDGPGLGAVYRVGQREGLRTHRLDMCTTVYERPTRLAWTMTGKRYDYLSEMAFESADGGTTITQTNTLQFRDPLTAYVWQRAAPLALNRQLQLLSRQLAPG